MSHMLEIERRDNLVNGNGFVATVWVNSISFYTFSCHGFKVIYVLEKRKRKYFIVILSRQSIDRTNDVTSLN